MVETSRATCSCMRNVVCGMSIAWGWGSNEERVPGPAGDPALPRTDARRSTKMNRERFLYPSRTRSWHRSLSSIRVMVPLTRLFHKENLDYRHIASVCAGVYFCKKESWKQYTNRNLMHSGSHCRPKSLVERVTWWRGTLGKTRPGPAPARKRR